MRKTVDAMPWEGGAFTADAESETVRNPAGPHEPSASENRDPAAHRYNVDSDSQPGWVVVADSDPGSPQCGTSGAEHTGKHAGKHTGTIRKWARLKFFVFSGNEVISTSFHSPESFQKTILTALHEAMHKGDGATTYNCDDAHNCDPGRDITIEWSISATSVEGYEPCPGGWEDCEIHLLDNVDTHSHLNSSTEPDGEWLEVEATSSPATSPSPQQESPQAVLLDHYDDKFYVCHRVCAPSLATWRVKASLGVAKESPRLNGSQLSFRSLQASLGFAKESPRLNGPPLSFRSLQRSNDLSEDGCGDRGTDLCAVQKSSPTLSTRRTPITGLSVANPSRRENTSPSPRIGDRSPLISQVPAPVEPLTYLEKCVSEGNLHGAIKTWERLLREPTEIAKHHTTASVHCHALRLIKENLEKRMGDAVAVRFGEELMLQPGPFEQIVLCRQALSHINEEAVH